MAQNVYERLGIHFSTMGMWMPYREELVDILRENLTSAEAEVCLALPTNVIPLQFVGVDDIKGKSNLPREELIDMLERLAKLGFVFSGKTKEGERGYALIQSGFGFTQIFFWKGEKTPHAKKMNDMLLKYYGRKTREEIFTDAKKTKAYRYVPVNKAIELTPQGIYDCDMMGNVVEQAKVIAVAHCPCRLRAQMQGKGCNHLMEVCIKFDDMAEYLIERGFGRDITKEEALDIIKKSAEDGLVHFVDNAQGHVKHNCNCCGCCCWNLGPIRRRTMPRDVIIATYFISEVDEDGCNGCSDCVDICPVNAITIENNLAAVDKDWCVGCGLCITRCEVQTIRLVRRSDVVPPPSFKELHETILAQRELR